MYETDTWGRDYTLNAAELTDDAFPFIVPDDASPEEVFPVMDDRKTLLVPRLQSMKTYIAFHYKRTIIKHLNKYLADRIRLTGKQYAYIANVNDVQLGKMDFRSYGKYTLVARIAFEAWIDFGENTGVKRSYYAEMAFDMDDSIKLLSVDISERITDFRESSNPLYCKLDEYLIPIMSKPRMEQRAGELLQTYNREGWEDQHKNLPAVLAHRMGLNIVQLPLHECKKNKSQIFFKKGTVTVDTDLRDENDRAITAQVEIDANTILINTNAVRRDYCMLEIYHECVHYEWHYMFYLLQDMYTNDLRQIKKTRSVKWQRRKKADALSWLEYQAVHASFAVWMPKPFMLEQLEMKKAEASCLHPGAMYELFCLDIADEYKIPPFRVRARAIRLGWIEARGACNYLDDHFIQPFSFDDGAGSGNYTFFITREQFALNYFQDQEFRKLIDSGKFIYADGHVCINDPGCFFQTMEGPMLVNEVLEHIDRYCLRFVEVYERDEAYACHFDRLHSDQEYNNHFLYFPPEQYTDTNPRPDELEQQEKNMRYLLSLPSYFPMMLTKLMDDCKVTVEELADRTGISIRWINSLRTEPKTSYSPDTIVALIIGLHMPPWVSDEFLKAAGINFAGNVATYNYRYVVNCMYMDPYKTVVRQHLARMGKKNLVLEAPGSEEMLQAN